MERFENIENKDMLVVSTKVPGAQAQTASNFGAFFIAGRPYEVMEIRESHTVAGSDGGAVTLNIERLSGTEALNAGDEILTSDFDLKGTANTVQTSTPETIQNSQLLPGDRLALKDTGTLTALEDVVVTVYLKPLAKGNYK